LLMAVVGSLLCLAIIFVCAVGENEGGGGAVVVLVAMALGHRAPRWAVVVGGCCERRSKTCRVVRTRRAAWLTSCVFVCWGWGGGGGHLRRGAATVPDASPRGASRRSSGCAVLAAQNANR
jgi:hypothetical protein